MKDRMKRLSILCLSVSLCTGNVYAEEVLQEETVVQETEA